MLHLPPAAMVAVVVAAVVVVVHGSGGEGGIGFPRPPKLVGFSHTEAMGGQGVF